MDIETHSLNEHDDNTRQSVSNTSNISKIDASAVYDDLKLRLVLFYI